MTQALQLILVVSLIVSISGQPSAFTCDAGWVKFQSSCYKFVDGTRSDWTESEFLCSLYGAKLVEIETAEENNFIKTTAHKVNTTTHISYWIGGSDIANEGEFRWMKSQEKFDFTDWHPGNPSDSGHHEDCVHLWYDYHYKPPIAWNDVACENKYNFICEKEHTPQIGEILG